MPVITRKQIVEQNSNTNSVASLTLACSGTNQGNLLVMGVSVGSPPTAWTQISMPTGWLRGPFKKGSGTEPNAVEIWYYPNNPGGITSVVVTNTGANAVCRAILTEYIGVNPVNSWVGQGIATGSTTSVSLRTATGGTVRVDDLLTVVVGAFRSSSP